MMGAARNDDVHFFKNKNDIIMSLNEKGDCCDKHRYWK